METTAFNILRLALPVVPAFASAAPGYFSSEDPALWASAHLRAATGLSSADEIGELGTHNHDLNDDVAVQGLEFGLNFEADLLKAFAGVNVFTEAGGDVDYEVEELFGKIGGEETLGFELRFGRYQNRLGLQNNVHLHGWDFADANLSTGMFLGEEGLISEGGELSWFGSRGSSLFGASFSYGEALSHDHEEEEEEGDHEEEGHDEHGHSESIENAFFQGDLVTARAFVRYNQTDFHQHQLGVNYAFGDNGYERDTTLVSADYTYEWRENGLESGGRAFRIGVEGYWRDVEWRREEEPDETGDSSQLGAMIFAGYDFNENWSLATRYEWIEGVADGLEIHDGEEEYGFQVDERRRLSAAITYRNELSESLYSHVRLQFNHDELEDGQDEQSVFLQVGFDFGSAEIR